jgi:uncharacterized protein (TIGR02453 family)
MKEVFDFLLDLRANNNRDWFQSHKSRYNSALESMKIFQEEVGAAISRYDVLDASKSRLYRIYRDVRFSKDKTPYKSSWSMSFARAGSDRRGGYYLQLSPGGGSFLATGFWGPDSSDLLHIRKQISQDPEFLQDALDTPSVKKYFGGLQGDAVKTAPKGFDKNDPAIALIRYKQFILTHSFSDAQVCKKSFPEDVAKGFSNARPFLKAMTEILTTDLNGMSLL